jgi:hypothetical protein
MISVRRASVLPAASFRFYLTIDTLAVQLTVPPTRPVRDLHPQVNAPCRAHNKKKAKLLFGFYYVFKEFLMVPVIIIYPPPFVSAAGYVVTSIFGF